jgi:hypothetical protein
MKSLDREELRVLERAARGLLAPEADGDEELFLQSLRDAGLVSEIKHPSRESSSERPLVTVVGKPVSETIIEDRG